MIDCYDNSRPFVCRWRNVARMIFVLNVKLRLRLDQSVSRDSNFMHSVQFFSPSLENMSRYQQDSGQLVKPGAQTEPDEAASSCYAALEQTARRSQTFLEHCKHFSRADDPARNVALNFTRYFILFLFSEPLKLFCF